MRPKCCNRIALSAALLLSACGTSGLAFRVDESVEILSPRSRSSVELPFDLRWRMKTGSRGGDSFAVFIDRAPMPPGKRISYLAKDDDACRRLPGCPDEAWLNARNIYTTRTTSLTIRVLPDTRDERDTGREPHEVTIVMLDSDGRRKGESAFFVDFFFDRDEGR